MLLKGPLDIKKYRKMEILSQMWCLLGFLVNILPNQILAWLHFLHESLQDFLNPHSYFEIVEFNGYVDVNDLYRQAAVYLNSINPSTTCRRLSLSRSKSSAAISFSPAADHTIDDDFRGHRLSWTHHVAAVNDSVEERRSFTLRLPKNGRVALLGAYMDHVAARAAEFERVARERRLYTNNGNWSSVTFRHPSTFDTLALEPELKKEIIDDLTAFVDGGDFYRKIGRAWKRGYLLNGPPGAGKSSLIAAMANFLRYDVYDLELSKVEDNSELRSLLMQTTNRSIVVIEDIDCSVDLTGDRSTKKIGCGGGAAAGVTLSGLLNFTDGLWSCCGEERVIVFTTNRGGAVDPALLRRGRMDVHVSLGTCGAHAFRALARNYLGLESHVLFDDVESCMRAGGALTPAQIGEIFLRHRKDADVAVKAVLEAMQAKILGGDVDGGGCVGCDDVAKISEADVRPCEWEEKGSCNWEGKVNFLVRLKSLTESDSERRGVES